MDRRMLYILRQLIRLGVLFFSPLVVAAPITVSGTFAFQGGQAITDGHLRYETAASDPLEQHISIWMTSPGTSQPITSYSVEMTQPLHVIIVDSSLSTFAHIHPTLGADGVFRIDHRFARPGSYYLYADGLPNGADHQVFRFPLQIGTASNAKTVEKNSAWVPTGRELTAGPYTVDLSKARLTAGAMDELEVGVYDHGAPAKDLHPYLGAPAHAVFLNVHDLSYVHVHPMSPAASPPDLPDSAVLPATMMLHVSVKEPGLYKMWLQFRGGRQLYIVPFVLRAE